MYSSGARKRKAPVGTAAESSPSKRVPGADLNDETIERCHKLLEASAPEDHQVLECLRELAEAKESRQSLELVQKLLEKAGSSVSHILSATVDKEKRTLLHKASAQANLRICALFLQHGANAEQESASGSRALEPHELRMALEYLKETDEAEDHGDAFGEDSEEGDDDFDADAQSSEGDDDDEGSSAELESTEEDVPNGKRNGSLLPQEPQAKSARLDTPPPPAAAAAAAAAAAPPSTTAASPSPSALFVSSPLTTPPASPSASPPKVIPRSLSSPTPSPPWSAPAQLPSSRSATPLGSPSKVWLPTTFLRCSNGSPPACLDASDLSTPPRERFPTGALQKELEEAFRLIVFVCEMSVPDEPLTVYDADRMVCLAGSGDPRLLALFREHVRSAPNNPSWVTEHSLVFRSRVLALSRTVKSPSSSAQPPMYS